MLGRGHSLEAIVAAQRRVAGGFVVINHQGRRAFTIGGGDFELVVNVGIVAVHVDRVRHGLGASVAVEHQVAIARHQAGAVQVAAALVVEISAADFRVNNRGRAVKIGVTCQLFEGRRRASP